MPEVADKANNKILAKTTRFDLRGITAEMVDRLPRCEKRIMQLVLDFGVFGIDKHNQGLTVAEVAKRTRAHCDDVRTLFKGAILTLKAMDKK